MWKWVSMRLSTATFKVVFSSHVARAPTVERSSLAELKRSGSSPGRERTPLKVPAANEASSASSESLNSGRRTRVFYFFVNNIFSGLFPVSVTDNK